MKCPHPDCDIDIEDSPWEDLEYDGDRQEFLHKPCGSVLHIVLSHIYDLKFIRLANKGETFAITVDDDGD